MKKLAPIALALVLLCILAASPGCVTGDADKAQRLIKEGNADCKAFEGSFSELADILEAFFAGYSDLLKTSRGETVVPVEDWEDRVNMTNLLEKYFAAHLELTKTSREKAEESIRDFQGRVNRLRKQVNQAKEPYRKVMGMEGVKPYSEYARLRLQMLDKIDDAGVIITNTLPLVSLAILTGDHPDNEILENAKRELIAIELELSFIGAEADQFAVDNGLFK